MKYAQAPAKIRVVNDRAEFTLNYEFGVDFFFAIECVLIAVFMMFFVVLFFFMLGALIEVA